MKSKLFSPRIHLIAFCLGFAHSAQAVTSTWTSTTAGAWNTAGSWDNGVPTSTVDAVLNNGGTIPQISVVNNANMATLSIDAPSVANVLNYGGLTPQIQYLHGGTGKPLLSVTTNASTAVTVNKVDFRIRVNGALDIATGKTLTLGNSYISENSAGLKLTKTGGGTLAFTGSSNTKITFTGGLDMQEGTWIASQNFSSLPSSGLVNFTNASGTNAKITVNADASIEALGGGNSNSIIDGSKVLTVTGAQNTTYAGTMGGSVALKLTGSGSLALTRTNTYTGATQVDAGKLLIGTSGSLGSSSAVTVGGTTATPGSTPSLGGGGTINGTAVIASAGAGAVGTHAPGIAGTNGGVGTQTFKNSLTYQAGSIFEWDLKTGATGTAGTQFDAVTLDTATGSLAVDNNATTGSIFKVVLGETFAGGNAFWSNPTQRTWNVFATTNSATLGANTNIFSRFQLFDTSSATVPVDFSSYGSFGFTNNGSTGTLTWTAVPEPTSALAGLLITAGLLRRRRALADT